MAIGPIRVDTAGGRLLATMAALVHGPLLAVMGLFGAYVVPLLVGGEGGSVLFVLSYSLITLSSMLLMQRAVTILVWRCWALWDGGYWRVWAGRNAGDCGLPFGVVCTVFHVAR